jgi:hypothetical protein
VEYDLTTLTRPLYTVKAENRRWIKNFLCCQKVTQNLRQLMTEGRAKYDEVGITIRIARDVKVYILKQSKNRNMNNNILTSSVIQFVVF